MARVLIVDDAAFMRMMLREILTKAGYEVVGEASNGKEAIEYIDTNSKKGIEESSDHIIGIFL